MFGLKEPIHPGEYLRDDHLAEFELDGAMTESEKIRFIADNCGVDIGTFEKIINEEADVTESISKKLGNYFEKDDHYFLRIQLRYDSNMAELKMPKLSKMEIILMALSILNNRKYHRGSMIQKIMYCIDSEGSKYMGVPFFNFKNSRFGQFDEEVFNQLETLCKDGFALKKENFDTCSDNGFNRYKLSKKGIEKGRQLLSEIPQFTNAFLENAVEWTYDFESEKEVKWNLAVFLKDVFSRFLELIGNSRLAYKK